MLQASFIVGKLAEELGCGEAFRFHAPYIVHLVTYGKGIHPLNTGGTALRPQEIRNAVYRGKIVEGLLELNDDPDWQAILGLKAPDRSQKDVELVLRLFGLYEDWDDYEKPMLHYLNKTMKDNREFKGGKVERFKSRFPEVTALVNDNLEKPFRPKRVVNSAVLEAVMVTLLENPEINGPQLKERYAALMLDEGFSEFTTGATTDTSILKGRLEKARAVLV